jgi:hypothetical protein
LQAAYEQFGCNQGNVFFLGIDKGSTNANVIYYDSVYGIQYPTVSGQQGGGNPVHLTYEIQGTPTVIVITPDHVIAVKQIFPPATAKVVDSVMNAGGLLQDCTTEIAEIVPNERFTLLPNPAIDRSYLSFKLVIRNELEVKIFDAMGCMVRKFPLASYAEGDHHLQIDLKGLREGLYYIHITDSIHILTVKKLIKSQ